MGLFWISVQLYTTCVFSDLYRLSFKMSSLAVNEYNWILGNLIFVRQSRAYEDNFDSGKGMIDLFI